MFPATKSYVSCYRPYVSGYRPYVSGYGGTLQVIDCKYFFAPSLGFKVLEVKGPLRGRDLSDRREKQQQQPKRRGLRPAGLLLWVC